MPRVSFYTLGCKLNFTETGTIGREFSAHDFEIVPFGEPADVTVINTCTVTDEADRKCRQIIRRAIKLNPGAFIAVTGCYAQLKPDEIAAIEGVDVVLGTLEKSMIFELVRDFSKREKTQISVSCIDATPSFGPSYASGDRTRVFLKIQDGCDYSCSFCTIPKARGGSRSQTISETIKSAKAAAENGHREIVLSGVNIGLFGHQKGETLLDLFRHLELLPQIERFRISSIEPNLITAELIRFVADSKIFVPHFHIPLQSGDNHILGKMRRRYRRELYADRVSLIKQEMPHACIGADVIVGFPGEELANFDNTIDFVQSLPVSYLHVFSYSERANTAAVLERERSCDSVPKSERSRRNRILTRISQLKRHEFYKQHLGTVRPVLWESAQKDGSMHGFTDNYIKVQRKYDVTLEGKVCPVILKEFASDGSILAGS